MILDSREGLIYNRNHFHQLVCFLVFLEPNFENLAHFIKVGNTNHSPKRGSMEKKGLQANTTWNILCMLKVPEVDGCLDL